MSCGVPVLSPHLMVLLTLKPLEATCRVFLSGGGGEDAATAGTPQAGAPSALTGARHVHMSPQLRAAHGAPGHRASCRRCELVEAGWGPAWWPPLSSTVLRE